MRKTIKRKLIDKYPHLEKFIEEKWEEYSYKGYDDTGLNKANDFKQTKTNIAYNIECDIETGNLYTKEEAIRQGIIDEE